MAKNMLFGAFVMALGCATAASAQMTVHAVTGMVKAANPNSISVMVDDGQASRFSVDDAAHVSLAFEGDLRANSVAPATFSKVGDYVLLYYYGWGDQRTAVAVKDLGAGPFTKVQGAVVSYDKHSRKLVLKDASGKEVTMALSDAVVVDTDTGVASGRKFSPHKGDQVRVTFGAGATPTVAFLRETL